MRHVLAIDEVEEKIQVAASCFAEGDGLTANLRSRNATGQPRHLGVVMIAADSSTTHELSLQNIVETELDRRHMRIAVCQIELELADVVGADRHRDLVELLRRVLVDGQQDSAIVERLGAVLVGAETVRFALALELSLVSALQAPWQHHSALTVCVGKSSVTSLPTQSGRGILVPLLLDARHRLIDVQVVRLDLLGVVLLLLSKRDEGRVQGRKLVLTPQASLVCSPSRQGISYADQKTLDRFRVDSRLFRISCAMPLRMD